MKEADPGPRPYGLCGRNATVRKTSSGADLCLPVSRQEAACCRKSLSQMESNHRLRLLPLATNSILALISLR